MRFISNFKKILLLLKPAEMYEITYYSVAKGIVGADDISAILKKARDFNLKNNITGCLLFHKNQFIQILEGDKDIIKDLLSKIEKDKRHTNIIILAEGEKELRTFKDWTMAYRELSDDDVQHINESLFIDNFLTFSALATKPTRTIKSFWSRAQRLLTDDYTT
jgi:Sensors of blue-light using FAD